MKFPASVIASVFLFVAETAAALYLSSTYRSAGDRMWQVLTLLFSLMPCALVQFTLLFVHRDLSRDRPLALLMHLLQLGPLYRYVSNPPPTVRFDSALSLLSSGIIMTLSLLSIVYGALRCNILAIKIKYDEYEVKVKPLAYVCIFLWRSFEIATRVIVLVLFTSVLKIWVVAVILVNFFSFFLYPWIVFWCSGSPFPENIEKALSRVGTTIVLCFLTLLYAGINMFCWSAVQLKIDNPELISKSQNWYRLLIYYMTRFIENSVLLLLWYFFKTDIYMYVCAPLLILQLLIGYCTGILFMLVFYQFFHPCKKLFSSSVSESFRALLRCACWSSLRRKSSEPVGRIDTDLKACTEQDVMPTTSKVIPEATDIWTAVDLCSA
ncbi:membrane transport protein XK [Mus caroli]|uniref:XK-related protein n=1 Tax=Mus caroli TaxID=10089 RepID=A0A6P7QUQ7_MUSCR|nr:membrane transport protein XK [Mus caroli]